MHILIGLVLALVLIALFSNRATRRCRWREYPRAGADSDWKCVHCGAGTTGPRGKPPRDCLRGATV